MKKNLMFLALAAAALASCNGGFKKGEGGLLYNIHTDKSGTNIVPGDFISANLIVKNDEDSVLKSTYESGAPTYMLLQKPSFKGDVYDGLSLLSEGDSATIKIAADSIFKRTPKPPGFKGKYIIYDVKIEKVIAKGKLTDQVFQGTVTSYVKAQADVLKNQEQSKIQKYITDSKLAFTKTASGLYYIITKPGSGPLPAANDTVGVNYVGKSLNGKVFDTNIKAEAEKAKMANPMNPYEPIRFPVGQAKVIPGWDEGLRLLNKGAKATFIVPSSLAYGEQGNPPVIAPFASLVFEVELTDIKKPNPNAPKPAAPAMMPQPAK